MMNHASHPDSQVSFSPRLCPTVPSLPAPQLSLEQSKNLSDTIYLRMLTVFPSWSHCFIFGSYQRTSH